MPSNYYYNRNKQLNKKIKEKKKIYLHNMYYVSFFLSISLSLEVNRMMRVA